MPGLINMHKIEFYTIISMYIYVSFVRSSEIFYCFFQLFCLFYRSHLDFSTLRHLINSRNLRSLLLHLYIGYDELDGAVSLLMADDRCVCEGLK